MKNTMKKIFSIITMSLLATSISPVSASPINELEAISSKQEMIANLESVSERKLADLLIESGCSISETRELLASYEEGVEEIASRTSNGPFATNTNFYSGVNCSSNQHYGVVIKHNGSTAESIRLNLTYDSEWIGVANNSSIFHMLNGIESLTVDSVSNTKWSLLGYVEAQTTSPVPIGLLEFPFNVNNIVQGNKVESSVYHKFTFERQLNYPLSGPDTIYSYETYVLGDVNHDGKVTNADVTYLSNYLIGDISNLSFTYTDKSYNVAKIVNDLAMDANKDGSINLADLATIRQHVE